MDKALLRRDPDAGRYSIHELLRQYAEEQLKLSIGEEGSAHEDHAKHFADFMKTREAHLHDNRSKAALLERDEAEKLRVQIETQLDQPRYLSAWEAGQSRRLADVVAQSLRLEANLSAEEQTMTIVSTIPVS